MNQINDNTKFFTCSICKDNFTGFGNNADPINDGRCCDVCNDTKVIPARIAQIISFN